VHLYSLSHMTYLYIYIFSHTYIYVVLDSLAKDGYRKTSGYCGGLDPDDV
jgi:DNA-binding PadR family transcriptional regulator